MIASQPRLLDVPLAGLYPVDLATANGLLVDRWQHRLGPVNRPFRSESFALELQGQTVAVAVSASTVSDTVAGYRRDQVVELARLAAEPWATRVMLRLWREACAPRWSCWPVLAAVSYSHNALHRGDLYRFDGWERVTTSAGKSGGGWRLVAASIRRRRREGLEDALDLAVRAAFPNDRSGRPYCGWSGWGLCRQLAPRLR